MRHKSAIKAHRASLKKRARNRHYKSTMRGLIKGVRAAIDAGDKGAAEGALAKAISYIDATASKGSIHKRTAARYVSRLQTAVNGLS